MCTLKACMQSDNEKRRRMPDALVLAACFCDKFGDQNSPCQAQRVGGPQKESALQGAPAT